MSKATGISKALGLLRNLPRVNISNLKSLKENKPKHPRGRGQHGGKDHFHPKKRHMITVKHNDYPRVGFEYGQTPFYLKIPKEFYNRGHQYRRQYPPLSLLTLQMMIDTNQVDPNEPIDISTICNTKLYWLQPELRQYGIHLTDEGTDIFQAKINIEVQWISEPVIAAIEKNGGTVSTSYYDLESIKAASDPEKFFRSGRPIPRRCFPTEDCVEFYLSPDNRGYLADPEKIAEARVKLSQKYGYVLPDVMKDEKSEMLTRRKDPRQIFFGLEPGWAVNLKDKVILKPKNPDLKEYYQS